MTAPPSITTPGRRIQLPLRTDRDPSSRPAARDEPDRIRPDRGGSTPHPTARSTERDPAAPHASTPPAGPSAPTARPRDDYEHLNPLLARYAHLAPDHPDRGPLREHLARELHPVAAHIATRYRGRGEPVEDLEQVGALGLLAAIDRFDPDHGSGFLAFAVPTITGEIRRHFRDRTWSVHVPRRIKDLHTRMTNAQQTLSNELGRAPRVSELAARLAIGRDEVIDALAAHQSYRTASLDVPLGGSTTTIGDLIGGPDNRIEIIEARESVLPAIRELPERERTILRLRFFENMTQTEIGAHVGVSQMHISRLLDQTLTSLRGHLTADPEEHRPRADTARQRAGS